LLLVSAVVSDFLGTWGGKQYSKDRGNRSPADTDAAPFLVRPPEQELGPQ
jgi:hypothetical protein